MGLLLAYVIMATEWAFQPLLGPWHFIPAILETPSSSVAQWGSCPVIPLMVMLNRVILLLLLAAEQAVTVYTAQHFPALSFQVRVKINRADQFRSVMPFTKKPSLILYWLHLKNIFFMPLLIAEREASRVPLEKWGPN